MHELQDNKQISGAISWAILVIFCALIVAWGCFNYAAIRELPRHHDYGTLPDVPGQSVYATSAPADNANPPDQIPKLPEGKPRQKAGGTP
jgi:hypothetical protein